MGKINQFLMSNLVLFLWSSCNWFQNIFSKLIIHSHIPMQRVSNRSFSMISLFLMFKPLTHKSQFLQVSKNDTCN